ncbi:MAG: hypothetical protein WBO84_12630 [Acidimicrobiia bacterium]|jgi:hypothetical protein
MVRLFILVASVALILVSCSSSDSATDSSTTSAPDQGTLADDSPQATTTTVGVTTSSADSADAPPADPGVSTSDGNGVILADLCSEGQPLNGAISLDDLVAFGLLSSTDATVEGSGAYDAVAYETFGFLCNISEAVGDGVNFTTIGVSTGSATWDLAVEQGTAPAEQIGDWEVIVGSNWLSPLTMRSTDAAGNQDSLFVTWTPADGSIPDAATLERLMRPLAEAIATRSTVDIPRT